MVALKRRRSASARSSAGDDLDPRPHPGEPVQNLMQHLRQHRIVIETRSEGLDLGQRIGGGAMQPDQRLRRLGKGRDEIAQVDLRGVQPLQKRIAQQTLHRLQGLAFTLARQVIKVHPQVVGDAQQQRAAHIALGAFDQVQIAGRDPDHLGQTRLGDPCFQSLSPDPVADRCPHPCPFLSSGECKSVKG